MLGYQCVVETGSYSHVIILGSTICVKYVHVKRVPCHHDMGVIYLRKEETTFMYGG